MKIEFDVPGIPKATPRTKSSFNKHTGKSFVYTPKTADDWKACVKHAYLTSAKGHFFEVPVQAVLVYRFQRPVSHFRTGKHAGELKPSAPMWCDRKPDWDNLGKAVCDALNGVAYKDDSMVVDARVIKLWSDDGTSGCLMVFQDAGFTVS
jgi:Holliday junction resolvase RusA-like endonuclease